MEAIKIEDLRRDPSLMSSNRFYLRMPTASEVISHEDYNMGHQCTLNMIAFQNDTNVIGMNTGTTDYYFPYIHGTDNPIGEVKIKCSDLKDGAIAITSQMNGCALDVRYSSERKEYIFIHDKNGNNIDKIFEKYPSNSYQCICRIESDAYMTEDYSKKCKTYCTNVSFQFVCVYKSGVWYVGVSELYVNNKSEVLHSINKFLPLTKNCVFNNENRLILDNSIKQRHTSTL